MTSNENNFDKLVDTYNELLSSNDKGELELEVRFGTRNVKPITKINYNNVLQHLLSSGYNIIINNDYTLKMNAEFIDLKGVSKESNVRIEVQGLSNIETYCKTNDLTDVNFNLVQKTDINYKGEYLKTINVDDYNFRLALSNEQLINKNMGIGENIINKWKDSKKSFRYMNRITLQHDKYPLKIDLSIIKESKKRGRNYILNYTMQEADVLNNKELYSIEIELINDQIKDKLKTEEIIKVLRKCVRQVLCGFQETNYPLSYLKINELAKEYYYLLFKKELRNYLYNTNFIGPGSYTLQLPNIVPINEDLEIPNIRNNYTVTEKADGLRKLLFINKEGIIVLMDTNMNIQGTGIKCNNKKLFNTILDGEHITHNKKGDYINLYAAFDIYFLNGNNIRSYGFVPENTDQDEKNYRLPLLHFAINNMEIESLVSNKIPIRIEYKNFKIANISQSIFQCCNTILLSMQSQSYEYNTDGLIFTPANSGVGSDVVGKEGKLKNETWKDSFKWKPPEFNTIDFLITTKKNKEGKDAIGNIFEDGTSNDTTRQIKQYKTLILRVGFDEKKHGYINPCADIMEDNIKKKSDLDDNQQYKPIPFYPSNPSDANASICNIVLENDSEGNLQMLSEEEELIEDEMIVEFKYDITKPENFRWIPLRVRYDKTASYRAGDKQYGNAYHVANSNWYSIHNPITIEMLSTGKNIPDEIANDDIYYNRIDSSGNSTKAMRNFHNLYVKFKLIYGVSKPGNTLVDLAVGMGGDIPKWIKSKLSFVLGIDKSEDNIENRAIGACARYLNFRKDFQIMPNALFIRGDSSNNLKNGDGLYNEKGKMIMNAVFGKGSKDKDKIGAGVYKNYGKAVDGFQITSCQFALHYFFENIQSLSSFLRNVSEMTKEDGYFIGTCYDGKKIFNDLKTLKEGEFKTIFSDDDKKIWQIRKDYNKPSFENDESSLGYEINVYQDSINKSFPEYLVNFNYLTRLLENFGFVPLTNDEAKRLGFNGSIESFENLYNIMESEIKKNKKVENEYGLASKMSEKEKNISFYNNYFIYKKIRSVDSLSVYNSIIENKIIIEKYVPEYIENVEEVVEELEVPKPKKTKKKVKLVLSK
jgi:hypothetical protein